MLFVSYSFEIFVSCFHVNTISQHLLLSLCGGRGVVYYNCIYKRKGKAQKV